MKSRDLKRACTNKWKKDRESNPQEKAMPINPKCLRVDSAMSFLRSDSNKAFRPA
jgi:hypothetical protein